MELREILSFIKRRWWLIIPTTIIGLALALLLPEQEAVVVYQARTDFLVAPESIDDVPLTEEERLNNWRVSEYVAGGLADWINGTKFAELVSAELSSTYGREIPASTVRQSYTANRERSKPFIQFQYSEEDVLEDMMAAAIEVVSTQSDGILPNEDSKAIDITLVSEEPIEQKILSAPDPRARFLRVALGVLAGIALMFLVDYIDPRLFDKEQFELLDMTILAEIPKK